MENIFAVQVRAASELVEKAKQTPVNEKAPIVEPKKPIRRRRRPAVLVLFLLFLTVFGLAACEVAVRIYVWSRGWTPNCYTAELELFRPHPTVGYDLKPDFRLRSGKYTITTNELGLRGPPVAVTKPLRTTRIALLGESSAFGYLVSDGQEAARLLASQLSAKFPNVEIVNGGVPGYTLFHTLVRYREVIAPLKPDLVILYLGWNDVTSYVVSDTPNAERFRVRPIAPAWKRLLGHSTLYGLIFHRLLTPPVRFAPATVAGTETTPAGEKQFRENLENLIHQIQGNGSQVLVVSQISAGNPRADAGLRKSLGDGEELIARMIELGKWLHDTLKQVAEKEGVPFLDAYAEIEPTSEILLDYIHLSPRGEQSLANLLSRKLQSEILPQTRP